MTGLGLSFAFIFITLLSFAQEKGKDNWIVLNQDSLLVIATGDSLARQLLTSRMDSLMVLSHVRDSLVIKGWSDSIRAKVNRAYSPEAIRRFSDSLLQLRIPQPVITRRSDSLLRQKTTLLNEVSEKQSMLQQRMSDRYTSWTEALKEKFNLDSAKIKLPGLTPPATTGIPTTDAPGLSAMPNLGTIPELQSIDFAELALSPELASVGGQGAVPTGPQLDAWKAEVPTMPDPAGTLDQHLAEVKKLTSDPAQAAEKTVAEMVEASDATMALQEAEQIKQSNEALKAAEQLKDPEMAKQQAIDHFAGQEAQLQSAMSQVSKYKRKYSSLGSLSEVKKNDWIPKNGLKGKPFRERFRVAMNFGYRGGDTLLVDLFPNASYRITGRIEAGIGAIYRLRVTTKPFGFDQRDPVWGLSTFVAVKTFKSVFLRVEMDGNSFPKVSIADQDPYRDWRWSFLSGIQTNFRISKHWAGNVQMLYNFDSSLKDGFPEKLTIRFGVQYQLLAQ